MCLKKALGIDLAVLILVVVDSTLRGLETRVYKAWHRKVLILVVVDSTLRDLRKNLAS